MPVHSVRQEKIRREAGHVEASANSGSHPVRQRCRGADRLAPGSQGDCAGRQATRGISADLSRELARRLGVPVEFVLFEAAGKVADAAKAGVWDVAFLAIDPGRANDIAFTAPYVVIEGTYLVPADSPLRTIEDIDREGVRIAVGKGSAYDLYLTRTIKKAQLVRAPTSPTVIDVFRDQKLEVAAGVRQQLIAFASGQPDVRVMDGRFMVIEQAIGTPKGRENGLEFLKGFVEEAKASGFVADALTRSNQRDAAVAPPVR